MWMTMICGWSDQTGMKGSFGQAVLGEYYTRFA